MDGGGQICFTVTKHFVLVYVRHDVEYSLFCAASFVSFVCFNKDIDTMDALGHCVMSCRCYKSFCSLIHPFMMIRKELYCA